MDVATLMLLHLLVGGMAHMTCVALVRLTSLSFEELLSSAAFRLYSLTRLIPFGRHCDCCCPSARGVHSVRYWGCT